MADMEVSAPKITIGGVEYELDNLSDQAKAQMQNIRFCEDRIRQLQSEWAVADTARIAYSEALKRELLTEKA